MRKKRSGVIPFDSRCRSSQRSKGPKAQRSKGPEAHTEARRPRTEHPNIFTFFFVRIRFMSSVFFQTTGTPHTSVGRRYPTGDVIDTTKTPETNVWFDHFQFLDCVAETTEQPSYGCIVGGSRSAIQWCWRKTIFWSDARGEGFVRGTFVETTSKDLTPRGLVGFSTGGDSNCGAKPCGTRCRWQS